MEKKLHYQYVLLQCSFYAVSACFIGYMVPVLQKQGFNHSQIGLFLGLRALFSVIFQPVIANFMEKFQAKISFNQLIAAMVVVSMTMTGVQLLQPAFLGMTFVFILYGVSSFSMVSFIDAMSTLYFYQGKKVNYPVARGAGSLSYAISALLIGSLVEAQTILTAQFFLFIPLLLAVLSIEKIKGIEAAHDEKEAQVSFKALFKEYPVFKYFLLAVIFSFVGKEMSSSFLIDVYRSLGGDNQSYGIGTFLLASSEIPAAILFTKLLDRVGIRRLMLMSFFFAFLRIFLIMLAPNLFFLNFAQMLQMFGNGLFWAGNIQFIRTVLPAKYSVKAQAAVGVCYLGIGSGIGAPLSGVILEQTNLPTLLAISSLLALVGVGILYIGGNKGQLHV
ncbi:MFS transporter [Enterococcus sp.]|uniref:MFS transporter n=1 Tax=Enterococcus sp. TaxID=35783 RepID=UPI002FCB8302